MWHSVAKQLSETIKFDFQIKERTVINSAASNQCYMISDDNLRFFVKVNDREHFSLFEAEMKSLSLLLSTSTIKVPQPVICGVTKSHAFMILEYFPTKPYLDPHASAELGRQLAELHQWGDQKDFGYDLDNYVGLNLQPNAWHKKWCVFFAESRIAWQLCLLQEKGIDLGDIDTIVSATKKQLAGHNPKPSLLHGELTAENVVLSVGGPLCYDPSSYWGDREYDIAIIESFVQLHPSFMTSYQDAYPLPIGYQKRRSVYQLYHLLCLCNQFGGEYVAKAKHVLDEIL